jgi:ketosteroid isomerase-like protein
VPEENVEIVRRVYDASLRGDADAVIAVLDPAVRADMTERVFNPDVYEGHEGYRRFLAEIDAVWDSFRIEPLEFIDAGDKVVVSHMVRGRGKGSGVEVELPSTSVYTVREGLVTEIHMYREHGRALRAAGLSPQ